MEWIKKYLWHPIFLSIMLGILVLTNVGTVGYFLFINQEKQETICPDCPRYEENKEDNKIDEEPLTKIKVDLKGYVKKPGVYEVEEGTIINDLILLAGGLKSGGTTDNINLSKTLKNEDMIVINSKTELKKMVNSNVTLNSTTITKQEESTPNISVSNKKVSINTATKEELMTLSGIGESKAISIIEYRSENPFKTIEEIMNVTGIGESVYEKIKDSITI